MVVPNIKSWRSMALVTQVLVVCGLFYSRPPAAIRNPGRPPAAHLALILEEIHAGRGAWFRSPCQPLRSLRSERTPAQAQEWGGAAGAGSWSPVSGRPDPASSAAA